MLCPFFELILKIFELNLTEIINARSNYSLETFDDAQNHEIGKNQNSFMRKIFPLIILVLQVQ